MLQHSYLTELDCDARRTDYLREARADTLAKLARPARPDSLLARLAALFHTRRANAPAWSPASAAGKDRAGFQAA